MLSLEPSVERLRGERRHAPRIGTPQLTAWLSGPIRTPAIVRNVSAGGACIEPILPLRSGVELVVELRDGDETLGSCRAEVVRADGPMVALRFLESPC